MDIQNLMIQNQSYLFHNLNERNTPTLLGTYPIAQTQEPYSAIRFLAEHLPESVESTFGLVPVEQLELELNKEEDKPHFDWTPYTLAEAYAWKKKFFIKGGRVDVYRGANLMLRETLRGEKICLWFPPPPLLREARACVEAQEFKGV